MSDIVCLGGPEHGQRASNGPAQFTASDGVQYRNVGFTIGGVKSRFYVHDSIYNNRRQRQRLAIEFHYGMTWTSPTEMGYYWVRWKQRLEYITLVEYGVSHPGRFRLWYGNKPEEAVHRHALWSQAPLPTTAVDLIRAGERDAILVAGDWCAEHDHEFDAVHLRLLGDQDAELQFKA